MDRNQENSNLLAQHQNSCTINETKLNKANTCGKHGKCIQVSCN